MLNRLKSFFADRQDGVPKRTADVDELHLAAAVLLTEAARMDDDFGDAERARVARLCGERFGLDPEETGELVAAAERAAAEANELFRFTQVIRDGFSHDERVELVEMLWEVVYADGSLHDYESNLLRRVSGLIHVTDRESGAARKRVLARLGIAEA